ncbi:lantibiotic dehydratase [Streptomyces sp. NPDC020719]|uniref:lantibiotic dehydratase n=1 Tax=Streptomyces sp. NPDC020719 TaxID=3154896 RepID=UPI00340AF6F0
MPDQPAAPPLFRAAPVALLRAPLRGWSQRPDWAAVTGPEGFSAADRAACLVVLRGAAADSLFMDALRVASPSLARLVAASVGTVDGRSDAQLRRAALSVLRYELRLRTRCTPFGLFAGVAPARFDAADGSGQVVWSEPPSSRTRVDLDWLFQLIRQLEQQAELLRHLTLYAHTGTVRRGGRLVMTAPSNPGSRAGGTARSEVSVRLTPVVAAALELAGSGATGSEATRPGTTLSGTASSGITGAALAAGLQQRFPEARPGQIAGLLATLVRQEFLITGLRPVLDGGDPLGWVIDVLAAAERSAGRPLPVLAALRAVAADRDRYDLVPPGERAAALSALEDRLRALADTERPLHVDLALGARVRLPRTVADEAARAVDVLWRLAPHGRGVPHLRPYHREFLERYGVDRVVPLAELLDDTVGLGAPAGYEWPPSGRTQEAPYRPADARDATLARMVGGAVRAGAREVVLDDELVARLTAATPVSGPTPRSFQLLGSLVATDQHALADRDFRLVLTSGPSDAEAGATFGRFAGLPGAAEPVDSVLAELADLAFPEVDGAMHLGVAYQPRATRALNLANSRRSARHQVSIGLPPDPGATDVPMEQIGVSATLDHLYAVHLPTGRRLLPHAHNAVVLHRQAPNAARFLLEVGRDAYRMCAPWDWGASVHAPFLPRVRYGNVVLSSAVWRLDELRESTSLGPADWRAAVDGWRQRWRAPERIVLTKFDLRLPLDLSEAWHLELLRDAIAKDPDLIAVETDGGEDRSSGWLRDGAGHAHAAELCVAFVNVTEHHIEAEQHIEAGHHFEVVSSGMSADPEPTAAPARPRTTDPGGDWLYARLYLAGRHTDGFLVEHLPAFLAALPGPVGESIDRWFFIRYRDDADHLRLRFHGPADRLWPQLLPPLRDAVARWRAQALVGRFALDGYEPEWERYGGPRAQAAAERFFTADSRTALALLAAERRHAAGSAAGAEPPWDKEVLGALSVASIAHAFGAAAQPDAVDDPLGRGRGRGAASDRSARYQEPAAAWLSGVPAEPSDLPADFRARRAYWLALIDPAGGNPGLGAHPAGPAILAALADQADQLKAYRAELDHLAERGTLSSPLPRVLSALLHMSCNRLLGPDREAERRAMALARACVIQNADRRRHQR